MSKEFYECYDCYGSFESDDIEMFEPRVICKECYDRFEKKYDELKDKPFETREEWIKQQVKEL